MWNSGVWGYGAGVLSDIDLVAILAPKHPRLGGDILTSGARHKQAARHDD